tara:strand:+ start:924 stop:1625 length:702 start_codon:yes stop_codon:yes gene_type:complete
MATVVTIGNVSKSFPDFSSLGNVPDGSRRLDKCDSSSQQYKDYACNRLWNIDAHASFNRYVLTGISALNEEASKRIAVHDYSGVVSGLTLIEGYLTSTLQYVNSHLSYVNSMIGKSSKKDRCCQKNDSLNSYRQTDLDFAKSVSDAKKAIDTIKAAVIDSMDAWQDAESTEADVAERDAVANAAIAAANLGISEVNKTAQDLDTKALFNKIIVGGLIAVVVFAIFKMRKSFKL